MIDALRNTNDRLLTLLSCWQSWFDLGDDLPVEQLCCDADEAELADRVSRLIDRRRRLASLTTTGRAARSRR